MAAATRGHALHQWVGRRTGERIWHAELHQAVDAKLSTVITSDGSVSCEAIVIDRAIQHIEREQLVGGWVKSKHIVIAL